MKILFQFYFKRIIKIATVPIPPNKDKDKVSKLNSLSSLLCFLEGFWGLGGKFLMPGSASEYLGVTGLLRAILPAFIFST